MRKWVDHIESLGAHPLLTEALNLVQQARDKVADWVELPEAKPALPAPCPVVAIIAGEAGAGKDSVAEILACHHGYTVLGFADGGREAIAGLSGRTGKLYRDLDGDYNFRRLQQVFLGDCRESLAETVEDVSVNEIWVNMALLKMHYLACFRPGGRSHRFAVADMRHPGPESSKIKLWAERMGGKAYIVKVTRPGMEPIKESSHKSETSVKEIVPDITIVNDGTLDDLRRAVDTAAEKMNQCR